MHLTLKRVAADNLRPQSKRGYLGEEKKRKKKTPLDFCSLHIQSHDLGMSSLMGDLTVRSEAVLSDLYCFI